MHNTGRYLFYFLVSILGIFFAYSLNEKIDNYLIDYNYETYRFKSFTWFYDIFYYYKQGHYEPTIINDFFYHIIWFVNFLFLY